MGASGGTHKELPTRVAHTAPDHKFFSKGAEHSEKDFFPFINRLFRSDSLRVSNDPRILLDSVLSRRLGAFAQVSSSSILIASVAAGVLVAMDVKKSTWCELLSLICMAAVFSMNMFSVLMITQQYYHVVRLTTSGPSGFDIAKSYYLNPNICTLRHWATNSFFCSIPLLLIALGLMVYVKLAAKWQMAMAWPLGIFLSSAGVVYHLMFVKQRAVFIEKYSKIKVFDRPLIHHVKEAHERAGELDIND